MPLKVGLAFLVVTALAGVGTFVATLDPEGRSRDLAEVGAVTFFCSGGACVVAFVWAAIAAICGR